jgi:DNA-binding NtrC family response regulator
VNAHDHDSYAIRRAAHAMGDVTASDHAMKILVVDDQRGARRLLLQILRSLHDVELAEAKSLVEASEAIRAAVPDLVLLDIRLTSEPGDRGGLDLLRQIRETLPTLSVVIVTASSEMDEIRQAMRLGAKDYVLKDELSPELLLPIVEGIRERMTLQGEVARLRARVDQEWGLSAMVGSSRGISEVRQLIRRLADSDTTVLIRGDTGTGKEMVARALHELSPRRGQPFVAINCSALPSSLMESLIFGHERGAFTGAYARKPGQFELARGGTVLLDEVAEMELPLQAKLLRVLEDKRFRPLGAASEIELGARILASSHAVLERRVTDGTFREDLFYRLNVVSIRVPSLDERKDDIPELVHSFTAALGRKLRFTDSAIAWLVRRPWPGNVRELRNTVLRVSLIAESAKVDAKTLERIVGEDARSAEAGEIDRLASQLLSLPDRVGNKLDAMERAVLSQAMAAAGGNKTRAGRLLGLGRQAIFRRLRKFGEDGEETDEDDDSDGTE